jgi:hypothetical protein
MSSTFNNSAKATSLDNDELLKELRKALEESDQEWLDILYAEIRKRRRPRSTEHD